MALTKQLDLYEIFVNKLAGDFTIFSLMALAVISILAARFKMPNIVFGGVLMIFAIFIIPSTFEGQGSILFSFFVLAIMILSFLITKAVVRSNNV
jgi:hypothetical protein